MDTLEWMLQNLRERFGFKKKVVIFSDGATCQNWCSEVFNQMPLLAQKYRQNDVLESFRAMKSVADHSKGSVKLGCKIVLNYNREIDGCHSHPKEEVRRFIRRMAVSRKAGNSRDDDDHRTTGFENCEEVVSFLRNKPGYNVIRENEAADSKGFSLYIRAVKVADPRGRH